MKKVFSLLLALSLVLTCAFAFAEENTTCTYTVFNETGEKITELYVTDNTSGEKSENYAGDEGIAKGGIVEINGTNKEGYEKITELFVTDNITGEQSENYAGEGLADGASVEIKGTKKAGYVVTLSFKTESGYEGSFGTLHFEDVPISIFSKQTVEENIAAAGPDATSGATPIAFKAPEGK